MPRAAGRRRSLRGSNRPRGAAPVNHPVNAGAQTHTQTHTQTRVSALLARLEVVLVECQRLLAEPAPAGNQLRALQLRREEAACLLAELEALLPPAERGGGSRAV